MKLIKNLYRTISFLGMFLFLSCNIDSKRMAGTYAVSEYTTSHKDINTSNIKLILNNDYTFILINEKKAIKGNWDFEDLKEYRTLAISNDSIFEKANVEGDSLNYITFLNPQNFISSNLTDITFIRIEKK